LIKHETSDTNSDMSNTCCRHSFEILVLIQAQYVTLEIGQLIIHNFFEPSLECIFVRVMVLMDMDTCICTMNENINYYKY
jgi:hypothetical protein